MTQVLVLCGGTRPPRTPKFEKRVDLDIWGKDPSGRLVIENLTGSIVKSLDPLYYDLLEIAAYAYLADTEIIRWSEKDVLNEKWVRDLSFVIPVSDPEFWSSPRIKDLLESALRLASGDTYHFTFVRRRGKTEQLFTELKHDPFPGANAICLFSGGVDSLAGVVHAIKHLGLNPLLVSHRSSSRLDSRQENLRQLLSERLARAVHQVSVWLHREGSQARETTQRTRGFLFLTLAGVLAKELRISTIIVPENGPVSINLRKLEQSYNSTLSRTTNPQFIDAYEKLLNALGGHQVSLHNPFVFKTKRQVIDELVANGAESLIEETVSCAHIQGRTKAQPHCGTCSQCIDRRLATVAADVEDHDPPERYKHDIFRDAIPVGDALMQVEGHIRLMMRILRLSPEALADEFSDLAPLSTALPGPASRNAERFTEMMETYANDFKAAYQRKFLQSMPALLAKTLPPTCLLRLAISDVQLDMATRLEAERDGGVGSMHFHIGHIERLFMRDHYTTGQAGAVGPGASAQQMQFTQVWTQMADDVSLDAIADALAELRSALKARAPDGERDEAIGKIAASERAARSADGPTALAHAATAGKWVLSVAKEVGIAVATKFLERAMGLNNSIE